MPMKAGRFATAVFFCLFLAFAASLRAQQTLGGITGTITDDSGGVVPAATVTIVGDQTKLTRTVDTNDNGTYSFVNLPIGNYTITVYSRWLSDPQHSFYPGASESHCHGKRYSEDRRSRTDGDGGRDAADQRG